MQRGVVAHRLLQSLPNISPERQRTSAEAYLARAAKDFTPDERARILDQTLALINDARFAVLFGPGSRGEVPIVGRLACRTGVLAVTGQVDRLTVTESEVWIADFKTNRPPPRRIAEVPPAYVRQLSIYRAVLAQIYPGRTVRCALIWTEVPDLMELPADELDRKLDAIISS